MNFTLYTDKSVAQCMAAINERLQAKATKGRPALEGWIEKSGRFSIAVSAPVIEQLRIHRTTRLHGTARRESGVTVISGAVPDGISPNMQRLMIGVLGIVSLLILISGQLALALLVLGFGAVAYVWLVGDYQNSEHLLIEVERVLKASPKPPKKQPTAAPAAVKRK
jgi:hypothetical protein